MDELIEGVKGGPEILAFIVALASLVSAFVPDSKLPAPVAKVLNWLALNVGKAKNDPSVN